MTIRLVLTQIPTLTSMRDSKSYTPNRLHRAKHLSSSVSQIFTYAQERMNLAIPPCHEMNNSQEVNTNLLQCNRFSKSSPSSKSRAGIYPLHRWRNWGTESKRSAQKQSAAESHPWDFLSFLITVQEKSVRIYWIIRNVRVVTRPYGTKHVFCL